ncbi:MAG: DUF1684 domain-containing protein [Edaphocola sp.]
MKIWKTLLLAGMVFGTKNLQAKGKPFADSLIKYQQEYKEDLYKIIKDDTAYICFFEANEQYRVKAKITLLDNEPVFQMPTASGKTKDAQKVAVLEFAINGKPLKLYAYQLIKLREKPETAGELFVPFTDNTNGRSSYGGGRYIDLNLRNIKDGSITIDFNRAYNPYCAFTTGYNCPIPPKENYLNTKIKAGEKYLPEKFHH